MQPNSHFVPHSPTPATPEPPEPPFHLGLREFGDTRDLSRGLHDFLRLAELGARLQNRRDSVRSV